MEIYLDRKYRKADYSIGILTIGREVFCNTLEDTDRGLTAMMSTADIKRAKIYGKTAIPLGRYRILWTVSNSFRTKSWAAPYGGCVPLIDGVKGFDGVRIHPLNTPEETYGCIGVGRNTIKGQLTSSAATYRELLDKYLVPAFKRGESVWITIR